MPYYKDNAGRLHFLSDQDIARGGEAYLPKDCTPIDDAEVGAIRQAEKNTPQIRRAEIASRLAQIDAESIRALRAASITRNKGQAAPAFDANKLETLESEAAALRAEMAALGA